ncbi:preprotein translocase subunit SecE [Neomegalonema perideroedes]|uniref:preprotein translocase subunit SecE n=1 Tax=Neomegalonema perideroedes TaxID=217219 RepID=UPI00036F3C37|nr:preprotein translocase subunit SecE [Neomegalonema perideroedes]
MARTSPVQFINQVRAEAAKVTWPTRRETITATISVIVMAVLAAIFFVLVDQIVGLFIRSILSIGG